MAPCVVGGQEPVVKPKARDMAAGRGRWSSPCHTEHLMGWKRGALERFWTISGEELLPLTLLGPFSSVGPVLHCTVETLQRELAQAWWFTPVYYHKETVKLQ